MSSNREKHKALKRPFIGDDDDVSRKKNRIEISGDTSPQKDNKRGGKNLAANRLAVLKESLKKESESVCNVKVHRKILNKSFVTENNRDRNLSVDSNVCSTTTSNLAKSESLDISTKKISVNDRFRRALHRSQPKSDDLDDIIVEIDDSPGPELSRVKRSYDEISSLKEVAGDKPRHIRNFKDASSNPVSSKPSHGERLIKKPKRRIKNRDDQISSSSRVANDSFRYVVDDTSSPISNRLNCDRQPEEKSEAISKNVLNQASSRKQVRLAGPALDDSASRPLLSRVVCDDRLKKTETVAKSTSDRINSPGKTTNASVRPSRHAINDSAGSISSRLGLDQEPKSSKNRLDLVISDRQSLNDSIRLSKSFVVVSEASDSEEGSATKTPANDRLKKLREICRSSSGSKTLTPDSANKTRSLVITVRENEGSSGLRIPLNRAIFKSPRPSPEKNFEDNSKDVELTEIADTSGNDKSSIQDVSPPKSIFGAKVSQSSIVNNKSPNKPAKRADIFKHDGSSLADRIARIKNQATGTAVKQKSPTMDCTEKDLEPTRIVFKRLSDTNGNDKLTIEVVPPFKPIFGAKIYQNNIVGNKSPSKPEKRLDDIFRQDNKRITLADRIARIKNQVTEAAIKKNSQDMDCTANPPKANTEMSFETDNPRYVCPSIPKSVMVENWIDSRAPQFNSNEENLSDSMLVNVNDTLLNKTELLTEPQDDTSMEWDSIPEPFDAKKPSEFGSTLVDVQKEKVTCVVTDTNVFLHNLSRLKDLLNENIMGGQKMKIYIPWMVLQEMDHFKDNSPKALKSLVIMAQKFINKHLAGPDPGVIGQSVSDVCQQLDLGKCPDDKILACCLQAKTKFDTVILLSNDVNLCNKALANDIKAYNPKEILAKLRSGKYHKIKVRLQTLLSHIVVQAAKRAFGDTWSQMDMLQDCPWSFEGCLKRFKRYWSTVFSELLLKQCRKTIDELISLTVKGDIMDTDTRELKQFINKVKEFLFYLQDIDQFNSSIKKMRDEIDKIVQESSGL